MLWIETYSGQLINMAHVEALDVLDVSDPLSSLGARGLHVVVILSGGRVKPIAAGDSDACKKMLYRIQTYLGLDTDYNDRHVIRHAWLTHELP